MSSPRFFDWDDAKAAGNLVKHGVSFEVATTVFLDIDRLDIASPQKGEDRRKVLGLIEGRLFSVVYLMRGSECRIISARKANAQETKAYG